MKSFQDSIPWQKAMDVNVAVDIALEGNFSFKDQLFRGSLSSCNNIAGCHEIPSAWHRVLHLWIAKGSCNEVCSMLHLRKRRSYFASEQVDRMLSLQDEVGRLPRTYINNSSGTWSKVPGGLAVLLLWGKITSPFILS